MDTREGGAVEKRLSRMEKWLARCRAACRAAAWNSALMEIECLEAETKVAREHLWRYAAQDAEGKKTRPSRNILAFARVAFLACFLTMTFVLPLSLEQDTPSSFIGDRVAVLTSTEGDIIDALRESLSNENASRVVLKLERQPEAEQAAPRGAALAAVGRNPVTPVGPRENAGSREQKQVLATGGSEPEVIAVSQPANEPSVEEVISLVQVGQRALRVTEPAVRIVP